MGSWGAEGKSPGKLFLIERGFLEGGRENIEGVTLSAFEGSSRLWGTFSWMAGREKM